MTRLPRGPERMTSEQYRAFLIAHGAGPSKYHNRRTVVDGITFDSKREATRYAELRLLEKAGEIRELGVHTRYQIVVSGTKVGVYVADFDYRDLRTGEPVVEDVKGVRTAVYRLKKRLVKALLGIEIVEV